MRTRVFASCAFASTFVAASAVARSEPAPPPLAPDARIEIAPEPPEARANQPNQGEEARARRPEPGDASGPLPPRPRHKGLVLETTLGVLGFAGKFGHVSPPAYFMHAELGYELLSWFMIFGEGELAFAETRESQDASHSRAFRIWGFGGGARASLHNKRVGGFLQLGVGALTADIPHGALANLGFRRAESLGVQFGGKMGVEWYPSDRHYALCASGGPRLAQGFSSDSANNLAGKESAPLMWDVAVGLRYTF